MERFSCAAVTKICFLQITNASESSIGKQFCFASFLTVNFVSYNMQRNQISLILLHNAGIKNSYFKENLEKNFCLATLRITSYVTSVVQPIILEKKLFWTKKSFFIYQTKGKCLKVNVRKWSLMIQENPS